VSEDWSQLRDAMANAGLEVRVTLATCGLLKFFECPLIRAQGVLATVPAPDVESRSALLPRARREDPLHCGGGCIFFDWAPLPGNAAVDRACAAEGYSSSDDRQEILFRRELHVRDCSEH
jgi:hypothetical protein